jgi:hypothetical protein
MENMAIKRTQENFDMLAKRLDCLEENNLEVLESIKEPCICIGNGGSEAASYYASRILRVTNGIICINEFPRDILYDKSLKLFRNVLSITYSNNSHGINEALDYSNKYGLNTFVLTANSEPSQRDTLITYSDPFDKEHSFISIASTFEPMEALFKYYYGRFADEVIQDVYNAAAKQKIDINFNEMLPIEIMSGDNTYTAAKLLKSTILEAGLGIPVIHEKDNYRHGCSTLAHQFKNNIMIYLLNGKTELDEMLLNEAPSSYRQFIVLESREPDLLLGEFDLAIQSMFLCKLIAETQNKGLSKVDYNPIVKKLYYYKGKM